MVLPLYAAQSEEKQGVPRPESAPVHVPGAQAIHIKTYGCAHNQSDSEYMAGQLAAYGYTLVDTAQDADLLLINSCPVKSPSRESFFHHLRKASKPVVVAGCVPQADQSHQELQG